MRRERVVNVLIAMRDAVWGGLLAKGTEPGALVGRFERGEYGWIEVKLMYEAMNPVQEIVGWGGALRRRLEVEEVDAGWETTSIDDGVIAALGGGA